MPAIDWAIAFFQLTARTPKFGRVKIPCCFPSQVHIQASFSVPELFAFLEKGPMKPITILLLLFTLFDVPTARPQSAANPQAESAVAFEQAANEALAAMRARADELKIGGVAVVAFMPGQELQSWTSKMIVVGRYKDLPSATDKGSNLLGIAYAKASEMADTLKDSGSNIRPPMTGEFGWQGGVIAHGETGYLIAAFSGGKSEDDLEVSRAGLAKLKRLFPKTAEQSPSGGK